MNLQTIKLTEITLNPNQPRKHFDEQSLVELSESIKNEGLLSPIMVRPLNGKYEIVQGERRFRATQLAGLTEIQVFVNELTDDEAFHLAVIENIQREQMTPIEEAQAYMKYVEKGFTHEQIATKVSKSRTYVTSRMRLLKLIPVIQDWIADGTLTEGHAKQILKLENPINRLLVNYKGTNNPFEWVQYQFHNDYWYDVHKGIKITVNEIQHWADTLRYKYVRAIVDCLSGNKENPIVKSSGYEITSEMLCLINGLDNTLLTPEDYDFANQLEHTLYKEDFNEKFRPWMIDKFWDEARQLKDWTTPRELKLSDMKKVALEERSLDEITESINANKEKLDLAIEKLVELTGKSKEEIQDEVFSFGNVSRDTNI